MILLDGGYLNYFAAATSVKALSVAVGWISKRLLTLQMMTNYSINNIVLLSHDLDPMCVGNN